MMELCGFGLKRKRMSYHNLSRSHHVFQTLVIGKHMHTSKKKILWPEFTKDTMCLVTECVSFLILLLGNSESVTQCKLFAEFRIFLERVLVYLFFA